MPNLTYLKLSDEVFLNATLTETSENANFPVENLQVLPISKPYKTADGAVTGQKTIADFTAPQTIDIFGLVNHNFQSGATITIKAGSSTDPDGSQFTTTITWRKNLAWKILTSSENWQYWSFTWDDAGNPDNHLRAGRFMMGLKTTLSVQFIPEWQKQRVKVARSVENELGQPMVGVLLYTGTRVIVSFEGLTAAELTEVDDFLDSLDQKVDPLLLVPDSSETGAFFVRLEEAHLIEQSNKGAAILDIPFITDHLGKFIT